MMYMLALLGASLGAIADALCVLASRGYRPNLMLAAGSGLWALCCPVWVMMLRRSGGSFAEPAAAWSVIGALFTGLLSLIASGHLTRVQWGALGLIIVGAIVFAMGDAEVLDDLANRLMHGWNARP